MNNKTPSASSDSQAPDSQTATAPPAGSASPAAIIGIGCMFPKAVDLASYWQNIQDGRDCISETPATHWKPEDYFDEDASTPDKTYGRRGGFLDAIDFDPLEFGISPRDMEATDTTQLLGLSVAKEALRDAGYPADEANFDKQRVSVVLGVTGTLELVIPLGARLGHPIWRRALHDAGVDPATTDDVVKRIGESYVGWQENSFPGLLGNVAAGRIANRLDLHGTNCVVDAACASSLSAMHLAMLELQTGRSDMVITGGLDTFNNIFMFMCFSKTPALSPTGNCKPFAQDGDGTILGEGLGLIVLKRLEDAERDGDRIYAVIRGIGSSSDGKGDAVYTPSSDGQARALRAAYEAAGVDPRTVELIEAHGTGTKIGDAVEVGGLKMVYGELATNQKPWCALGSVKSMIGHTKAAAGAAGVIKAAMSLYRGTLPPTIKVEQPTDAALPGTTPFYVNTEKRPWLRNGSPRRAGVSAFGFGGSNFHCVLEEYQGAAETVDWDGRTQILAFSGPDRDAIAHQLESFEAIEDWRELRARAADLRAAFDAGASCRLLVVEERKRATRLLGTARELLQSERASDWSSPQGIYFGSSPKGKVAALFPGQGSQYPNMLRDLACQFPIARETLTAADEAFGTDHRLSEHIYPHAAFDNATRDRQRLDLQSTDVAQPAIGAVSLAALRILESFGFTFDAAAGHSYGELTALQAAGRLDSNAFHLLSKLRGKLMAKGEGDRGSMLAVTADRETIDAFVQQHDLDLVVANRNAPEQMVLSGATSEIERAEELLRADNFTAMRLVVAAAFHSPFVAEAAEPFAQAIANIELGPGNQPVFANTTGKAYPSGQESASKLLAEQLAKPVEFVSLIENLADEGVTTFVEVGPSRHLSGLVQKILHDRPLTVTAIDASRGKHSGQFDLARTLAQLCASGQALDLTKWDQGAPAYQAPNGKERLTISVSGANLFKPKFSPPTAAKPALSPAAAAPQPATAQLALAAPPCPSPVAPAPMTATADSAPASSTLDALLRLQEQTADLHRQYLDGQAKVLDSIQALLAAPAASAVATAAPPEANPVSKPAPAARGADIPAILLAIVADKTGYPTEMLELSMGLDADLGIDSIKRVEILSALQQQLPDAPAIRPEHLGELQTLGHIVDFLSAGSAVATAAPPAVATAPTAAMGKAPAAVARHVVHLERLPSPAGKRLALPAGAPIWITRDASGLGEKLRNQLKAEGFSADLIDKDHTGSAPSNLAGLLLVADATATDADIEALFALAQKAGRALSCQGGQSAALFATVSRLDGAFGFEAPPENVLSGGLAGLAKTAHFEWTAVTCKAVDVDARLAESDQIAERILAHLFASAPLEIGICADVEVTPVLALEEIAGDGAVRFTVDDVVVISGGARGVTAEIAVALATAGKPHLALLGRSALPAEEPAWLAGITGQAAIHKALIENAPGKPTPKELQAEYHRVLAEREIRNTLTRIDAAGSPVSYHAVDVRDTAAVASTLETVRSQHGAITGLVHGAGVLADSFIADKSRADFKRVYATKVEGLRALLAATSADRLRGIVLFSSSSARFGRKGQVDYAIGNEILNKIAQRESRARRDCKVLSINWGPWDGGMVTRTLRELFAAEGIEVIDLAAGAKHLLQELAADPGPVEIVVLGHGSVLPEALAAAATPIAPALAAISVPPELARIFERQLDFETSPCLRSHVLDGNAVLPVAMVIEWFGHGALHNNPGLHFCGFDDLRILKGVIITPGESLTVRVCADRASKQGQQFLVPVELCSGPADHKRTIHARATVVLGAKLPTRKTRGDAPAVAPYRTTVDEVYAKHLFHGPAFQGLETIEGCSEQGIVATARPAPLPREWIRAAPRSRWIADPLSIDCAFQMMILWSIERDGTPCLPTQAARYRQFQADFPGDGVRIEVRVTRHDSHGATADISWISADGTLVARMTGYECVMDSSLLKAFRDNTPSVTTRRA